ncbi:scoloptoxin SSD20-like [Dermacentor silvarum]|uniref:scoloptoxin SSD20-like n=1 Tax=Dermacentor silvarum TaxID=543639 RepID=UPI002100FA53|nr:scoloptoxin SSD20-like [Dermacentor silvarum]
MPPCKCLGVTSRFGARFLSEVTGVWYNNYMSAFSSPYEQSGYGMPSSENNYIRPGMRPLSSFCPTLIVDAKGNVIFATSATGGQAIISGVVQVLVRCLWMDHNVKQSVDAGRLHNQLHPEDVVYHENTTDKDVLAGLKWRGHELTPFTWPGAVVAVHRQSQGIYEACHDYRDGTVASSDGGELIGKPNLPL